MSITKNICKAWKAFIEHKRYTAIAVFIEVSFLIIFALLHIYYFVPMTEAALNSGNVMQEQMDQLSEENMYELESSLMNNQEFMESYHSLVNNLLLFLLYVYLLFVITRIPLWYLAHKSVNNKVRFTTVLTQLPLLALFWGFALILILAVHSWLTGELILPLVSSTIANIVLIALLVLSYYFAITGLSVMSQQANKPKTRSALQTFKNMFVYGIKYWKKLMPAILINLVIIAITWSIPFLFLETQTLIGLAIIIFVSIPTLAFARIHTITSLWQKQ